MTVNEAFSKFQILLYIRRLLAKTRLHSCVVRYPLRGHLDTLLLLESLKRLPLKSLCGVCHIILAARWLLFCACEGFYHFTLNLRVFRRIVLLISCLVHIGITVYLFLLLQIRDLRHDVHLLWLLIAVCDCAQLF